MFTVFYVVVFISGLLGNLSVIMVIVKSKGLHCAMNYYLISLAIADILIILLGISLTLITYIVHTYKGLQKLCVVKTETNTAWIHSGVNF